MKSGMSIRTARKWVRAFGICAVIAALMPALFGTIPAAVVCVTLVLFFLAFALLRMAVSFLVTVLGLVNKLPVVGAVNRWLGWTVGGIASLLDIYLVLCVVWALIVITGGNLTVLNDTVMSGSLYYKVFNVFNPFL